MAEKKERVKLKTPRFRLSFQSLFVAKSMEDGPEKFSGVALWPEGTNLKEMKAAAYKAGKEAFGSKWVNTKKPGAWPKGFRSPFRDGADKEDLDGYGAGVTFATLSANKDYPPVVFNKDRTRVDATDPDCNSIIYSGCHCVATVNVYAYGMQKGSTNKGVAFGLLGIQKVADDAKFTGGGGSNEDDFEVIEDDGDDPDNYEESEESESNSAGF